VAVLLGFVLGCGGSVPGPTAPSAGRDEHAVNDRCPLEAEDLDGWQDDDGCPDLDNDQDRYADADDLCPNDPETYQGYEDEDGCPDRPICIVEVDEDPPSEPSE
jgi:hypothetical protein